MMRKKSRNQTQDCAIFFHRNNGDPSVFSASYIAGQCFAHALLSTMSGMHFFYFYYIMHLTYAYITAIRWRRRRARPSMTMNNIV